MQLAAPVAFPLGGDPAEAPSRCWAGTPSALELRLVRPFSDYALEQLRARFLGFVIGEGTPDKAARTVLQMATETELWGVLAKVAALPPDLATSYVCERRRYLHVDIDMRRHRYLVHPALTALAQVPGVPEVYVDLLRRYATCPYPRYRMSSLAMALCLAAATDA